MIRVKNADDLARMRVSGRLAAQVRDVVARAVTPGVTTRDLDALACDEMKRCGCVSAFLGYRGFPAHICVSVNEEVVHGIPGSRVIQMGDLVSLDVGVVCDGWYGDTAVTVIAGASDPERMKLVALAEQALAAAIAQAVQGRMLSDIGRAVQQTAESAGCSVVRSFVGHGIGRKLHEDPQVPNFVDRRAPAIRLRAGMTLAIEPMINAGTEAVRTLADGWTVVTEDGRPSVHIEHTVAVGEKQAEILTLSGDGGRRG